MLDQRKQVATEVEELLEQHPLAKVLISMPGLGIRTSARLLLEIGDISAFATPGHLAAYAGLAPVTAAPAPPSRANTRPKAATRH
ncbi:hypothetical protein Acor_58260 [Acrocarpospora corrugata]|uniref:Transposase IS116/IS110/IS902 C-terminal domain-containing protein n=1 Tax=Acrocarpospora corrugata TaxID=35763 RepID=A0A5M3W683_9ACTN|nr:hypothetical protein Acor_58260 [Acrocarpospora corrugata]